MKISVAMATYNGGRYIEEQLESILKQLKDDDEVVISDDGSTDNTLDIIKKINDERIRIINGPKKGVKQNFGNAIAKCTGDYIFLADQDDIWMSDKVEIVLKAFKEKHCTCVVHDAEVFESDSGKIIEPSFFAWRKSGKGVIKNIWKNTYIGCCMAFKANIKRDILPIPNDIKMHDQWIGIICEKHGGSVFIPDILIKYRRHKDNQTDMRHDGFGSMIKNRVIFLRRYLRRK